MALTLAFFETGLLFGGVCLVIILWAQPILIGFGAFAGVVGPALAVSLCCLVSFYYNDLYDLRIVRGLREFAPRLVQALVVTFLLLAACYTLIPGTRVSGPTSFAILLFVAGLVLPVRAACYSLITRRPLAQRVLVLGWGPLARKIAAEIQVAPTLGYQLVGFVDDGAPGVVAFPPPAHPPCRRLGQSEFTPETIEDLRPDCIVVALTERRGQLPVGALLASSATGVHVEDGLEFYEHVTQKLAIESLSPSFLIFSRALEKSRFQLRTRRLVSLVLSVVSLILFAPLMALVAVLIKLDSQGPVFFVQTRTGLAGRNFRLFKFRTMREATPGAADSVWQREVSSRVTRVGKRLRRLHMDELPQFINLLRGDMDLIGPRPEMACNVKTMAEQIPYYPLRHTVRPGVTGWAQVKHGYSVSLAEVAEKTRYDLYYIKHMSLWLDLRILVDTVKIVLFGRGAQ